MANDSGGFERTATIMSDKSVSEMLNDMKNLAQEKKDEVMLRVRAAKAAVQWGEQISETLSQDMMAALGIIEEKLAVIFSRGSNQLDLNDCRDYLTRFRVLSSFVLWRQKLPDGVKFILSTALPPVYDIFFIQEIDPREAILRMTREGLLPINDK